MHVIITINISKVLSWLLAESGLEPSFWVQGSLYSLLSGLPGLCQAPEAWKALCRIF